MDPEAFRSKMSGLAFGNVMAAAARDYQKVRFLSSLYLNYSATSVNILMIGSVRVCF